MLQLISLLLENKPGALMRVTGVLSARGYNIESLTVARTLDPELSRMSIVVDIEPTQRVQVIKQINKLVNVLQVSDLTEGSAVRRELVLLWVATTQENRMAVLNIGPPALRSRIDFHCHSSLATNYSNPRSILSVHSRLNTSVSPSYARNSARVQMTLAAGST